MNGNCHFGFGAVCGSMLALNLDKIEAVLPNLNNTQEMAILLVYLQLHYLVHMM